MTKKNAVQVIEKPSLPGTYSPDEVSLIKDTVAVGATDLELKMFLSQCQRTGLDPITRQIYFIKGKTGKDGRPGKVMIQTSIDGFRLIAERTGKYEGQTKPEWCGDDGVWKEVWTLPKNPSAARIGVWKTGFREPLYAVAIFNEYAQKDWQGKLSSMWAKMPVLMISKVAESLAFRKAFPNDLSGIYTSEEMAQNEDQPEHVQQLGTVTKGVDMTRKVADTFNVPPSNIQKTPDNKAALLKLQNLLNGMGLHGKTEESTQARQNLLMVIFGTFSGKEISKLTTSQLETGIVKIKDKIDPASGEMFPIDDSQNPYLQEPEPMYERQPGDE